DQGHSGTATVVVEEVHGVDTAILAAGTAALKSTNLLSALTAGRPMPGLIELGQLEAVDVPQRVGFGPFVAAVGLPRSRALAPRAAMARQDLPDRRAMPAGQIG